MLICIALAGCSSGGGDDEPEATIAPAATPTAVPPTELGDVTWSLSVTEDGEPVDDLDAFPRDTQTIHAVVQVQSVTAGEVITARWSIDGAAIEAIDGTVMIDEATASGWVSFALAWEGETLWPVGTLGVEISTASGTATSGEIEIEST